MPYDLKSLRAPRLWGLPLKTLVNLLENGYSRRLIESPIIREAGIPKLRKLNLSLPPTMIPKYPQGLSMSALSAAQTLKNLEYDQHPDIPRKGYRPETIFDFADAYRKQQTTPDEVAEKIINAIDRSNQGKTPVNAIINWIAEDISKQASESARRFKKGNPRGILDGVPVAVKDEMDAIPYSTSVGTQIYGKDNSAAEDSTVVARLRSAGAIIIGKANMHEIGIGVTGQNAHFGVCRNPYQLDYHTGGSSSGSAAAVAAGLCPLAIGADGGGSIRIPAALCGVTGLKATWSRISEWGAAPICWSVGHLGPIGATVNDIALGYTLMAGADTKDDNTLEQPLVHLKDYQNNDLKKLRIGVYTPWFEHASKEVVDQCYEAIKILQQHGATRHEITIHQLDVQRISHAVTIAGEMLAGVDEVYRNNPARFGLDTRINLALATTFTARDYIKAQQIRTLAIREFHQAFDDVDVIITPSSAITAPKINERAQPAGESNLSVLTEIMRFATPGNMTGLPAVTVTAGYDNKGLPIGVQLMGRPWEEHLLLQLARIIEESTMHKPPAINFKLL